MASPGGNALPPGSDHKTLFGGLALAVFGGICLSSLLSRTKKSGDETHGLFRSFVLFFYSCFIKPHNGDKTGSQQDALESFYKKQAGAYDSTRRLLLQGRADLLALVAAQLESKAKNGEKKERERRLVWVDVGFFPRTFHAAK
jgi:betaine lipid synthase